MWPNGNENSGEGWVDFWWEGQLECKALWFSLRRPSLGKSTRVGCRAQLVKNPPAMQETPVWFLGWEDPFEKQWLPAPVFLGFPCGLTDKESTCNVGNLDSVPGLGRSPGEGKGYPLQYSGLENSMDYIVHGVAKSWKRLSDFFISMCLEWSWAVQNYVQVVLRKHSGSSAHLTVNFNSRGTVPLLW